MQRPPIFPCNLHLARPSDGSPFHRDSRGVEAKISILFCMLVPGGIRLNTNCIKKDREIREQIRINAQRGVFFPLTGFLDARALAVDYRSIGFRECLTEVVRYLGILEGQNATDPIRLRLLSHLNNYVAEMEPSPVAASFLPFQLWPWSFLHTSMVPANRVPIPRREAAPGPAVLTASALAYPSAAMRPAPVRRIPSDIAPTRRSFLSNRIASSSQRVRHAVVPATPGAMSGVPSPPGASRETTSRTTQIATFLLSPAAAGIPIPPAYTAPPALSASVQGPGSRAGASRLCRSWATEIGAF